MGTQWQAAAVWHEEAADRLQSRDSEGAERHRRIAYRLHTTQFIMNNGRGYAGFWSVGK